MDVCLSLCGAITSWHRYGPVKYLSPVPTAAALWVPEDDVDVDDDAKDECVNISNIVRFAFKTHKSQRDRTTFTVMA